MQRDGVMVAWCYGGFAFGGGVCTSFSLGGDGIFSGGSGEVSEVVIVNRDGEDDSEIVVVVVTVSWVVHGGNGACVVM